MKVLLDTHTFLWAIRADERLSSRAREIFIAGRNELLLSVASIWEILLKVQVGKIRFEEPAVGYLKRQIFKNNIRMLPILMDHVAHLESLPLHGDRRSSLFIHLAPSSIPISSCFLVFTPQAIRGVLCVMPNRPRASSKIIPPWPLTRDSR